MIGGSCGGGEEGKVIAGSDWEAIGKSDKGVIGRRLWESEGVKE